MTIEYTEEQKKEIAELIVKTREVAEWRYSGDSFYRIATVHIAGLVNQGAVDPYVLQVGQALHASFKQANSLGQPVAPQEPLDPSTG
jgi:hypothetical protein